MGPSTNSTGDHYSRGSTITSSRDSNVASTNDSTAVIVDSSLTDIRIDSQPDSVPNSAAEDNERSNSRQSTADTVNSGVSSRCVDSLNSRNSVISSRSSSSRGSSSGRRESSSREELMPKSPNGCEESGHQYEADEGDYRRGNLSFFKRSSPEHQGNSDSDTIGTSSQYSFGGYQSGGGASASINMFSDPCRVGSCERLLETQDFEDRSFDDRDSPELFTSQSEPYDREFIRREFMQKTQVRPRHLDSIDQYSNDNAEGATLDDVLGSLLALPSASRSPSPSQSSNPSYLGRFHSQPDTSTKDNLDELSSLPSSNLSLDKREDHSTYGNFRNHDLGPDLKNQTYHKSLSYTPSSSGSISLQNVPEPHSFYSEYSQPSSINQSSQQLSDQHHQCHQSASYNQPHQHHHHQHQHFERPEYAIGGVSDPNIVGARLAAQADDSDASSVTFYLARDEGEKKE